MSELQPSPSNKAPARPVAAVTATTPSAAASAASSVATTTQSTAPAAKPQMVDPQELQKKLEEAVKRLNEQMQENKRQLGFSVDNRLNRQIVRVTNQETGELVRQIPSEVVIRVANSIENLKGVLFDKEF